METRRWVQRRRVVVLLAIVAGVVLAGATWAAIPDATGTIHGCFKKQNGQLRVIDEGGSCLHSEKALDWSQTGPAGADSTKTVAGAINPDGTSQLTTDDFTTTRIGPGHYRIDFAPGTFDQIPALIVMPIGKSFVSGTIQFGTGGGAFAAEYFTVNIDTNTLADTLVNFIATPFTQG